MATPLYSVLSMARASFGHYTLDVSEVAPAPSFALVEIISIEVSEDVPEIVVVEAP